MSLQGTFDTLSVTELFGLLSTATKSGALRLEAGDYGASVLVRGGRCCAVDDGVTTGAVATEAELGARLVDVGFTLARQPEGSFRFSDGEVEESDVSTAFEAAVAEITEMVAALKDIETTVPSLDARLQLAAALPDEQIVIRAGEWPLLVGLQGGPTVRELVARAGEPLLDVCRAVKDLVDRGAIEVGPAATPVPERPTERPVAADPPPAPRPDIRPPVELREPEPSQPRPAPDRSALHEATARLLDPIEPYAPEAHESEPEVAGGREPVSVAADRETGGDEPSADRGALLRLFSALKE